MIGDQSRDTAAELRRDFDRSFAEAPREVLAPSEDLIAIRVVDDRYALRLSELSGLLTGQTVTPIPTTVTGLLGIAAFRRTLVPVYSLGVLLGHSAAAAPRWLGLVGEDRKIALAFDAFDGYLRVARADIARTAAHAATSLSREVVQARDAVFPLVDVPSIVEEITKRAHRDIPRKEK